MFLVPIKLINFDFSLSDFFFIQIFQKVLVLVPINLPLLSDNMDDG